MGVYDFWKCLRFDKFLLLYEYEILWNINNTHLVLFVNGKQAF